MSKIVVADSSCLIGLSKIGKLNILHQLFGEIIIPEAVFSEVVIQGEGRPGAKEVKDTNWIKKIAVKNEIAVKALKLSLGAGESEAIVLASECNAEFIILDDWKARQIAEELSLPIIGTIAVLYKAQEKGIIDNFKNIINLLRNTGFRFSYK